MSAKLTYANETNLCADDPLHDRKKRVVQATLLHTFKPSIAVFVCLLQRDIQVVVGLFSG